MDELKRRLHITLLYDFYGQLLTENQKNLFEDYYQNDLSLAEIAENRQISRQGVYDQLKRTEHLLDGYEDKLKLAAKFDRMKELVLKIRGLSEELKTNGDEQIAGEIEETAKQILVDF